MACFVFETKEGKAANRLDDGEKHNWLMANVRKERNPGKNRVHQILPKHLTATRILSQH